ncbi:MAG: hypothetical protein ACFFCO_03900 [Promethearchaeota archaeon]
MRRVLYYIACVIIAIGIIVFEVGQGIQFGYLPDFIPFVPNKIGLVIIGVVFMIIGGCFMGLAYYLQSRERS